MATPPINAQRLAQGGDFGSAMHINLLQQLQDQITEGPRLDAQGNLVIPGSITANSLVLIIGGQATTVLIGPPDSGGSGFRALRVPNSKGP
jgi:hypothetical protein